MVLSKGILAAWALCVTNVVKYLFEYYPEKKPEFLYEKTPNGFPALHLAATHSPSIDVVKFFVSLFETRNPKFLFEKDPKDGRTVLHKAAAFNKHADIIFYLFNYFVKKRKGFLDVPCSFRKTALQTLIVVNKDSKVVNQVLHDFAAKHPDLIFCADDNGWHALHYAAANSDLAVVQHLLIIFDKSKPDLLYGKTGAKDRPARVQTLVHCAAENKNIEVLKHIDEYFLSHDRRAFVFEKDQPERRNILTIAASQDNPKFVKYLYTKIRSLDELDAVDEKSRSVLHHATFHGSYNLADYLVGLGVEPDLLDSMYKSALQIAVEMEHFDIAELLSSQGADRPIRDFSGETVYTWQVPQDDATVQSYKQDDETYYAYAIRKNRVPSVHSKHVRISIPKRCFINIFIRIRCN
jgi:ankyrin repeat protein